MNEYITDYSNEVHLLLVSVSRHLYILKNRTLKAQKKNLDYNLNNMHKADRELIVNYFIADHLSGIFYGEIHSAKNMIQVEDFLYRAWSKKESFKFCGLPTFLSVPKTIERLNLTRFVSSMGIKIINPSGGFMAGIKHLKIWEDSVYFKLYEQYVLKNKSITFEELQKFNIEICIRESQRELHRFHFFA